jgi:hypothetical protein
LISADELSFEKHAGDPAENGILARFRGGTTHGSLAKQ